MLFPNENATDEAFSTTQDVDAALSKVAELSRKLRFARNSLTPINKLPVELLSEIFLYLQTPDHAVFVPISFRQWYQVLHVCRHWRDVAHKSPLLWTKVDICAHPGLLEEMLGKSRNAGLEVKTHLSRPSSRAVRNWRAVVHHVRRMRILNISADASTCYKLLNHGMIDVEVPRLETLRIISSDRSESLELPLGLFSKDAPRLQRLEFIGCYLPWDAPLLVRCPELKTLILQDLQMVPSIEPFLHVLQAMPLLEVLDIAQCLPPLLSPPTHDPVHLRHLRQLLLHDTPAGALALLKSIQMPRRLSATISCEAFDMIDRVSALSSLFHTAFEMNGTNGFRDLYLDTSTLTCRMRTTRDGSPRTLLEYPVNVALDGPVSFQRLIDVVVPLPLIGNMTSMSLDGKRVMGDRSVLRALLHAASNVQTLHVYHKTAMTVLAVLCADASAEDVDPEATADAGGTKTISLLLPRLEHLILEDVAMNWVWEHADVLNQLQETQFLRSIRGRPISELTVTACRQLTAEEIRVLCHLFVDVHWDGCSGVDDDGDGESGAEEGRDEAEDDPELWEMWEGNAVGWHS